MARNPYPHMLTDEQWAYTERKLQETPEQVWAGLVARGIIDEKGKVLVRMPFLDSIDDDEDDAPIDPQAGSNGSA